MKITMGEAGRRLRRDLDKFAESIPGAMIERDGNLTTVHMPSKAESDLRKALEVTEAEADLLDCMMDEEDGWDF